MATEPNKIIYSMVGVSKYYDKKAVLKDIYLSYFYGAKIGVIGLNGSGKSSLLRIMAGVDKEINGEAVLSPGYTVGFLEQEPLIDDTRIVRQVVEEAVQDTVSLLKEFEEINAKFAEEMSGDAMNALLERQGEVQEKLDHQDAWDLDARLEMAMDALRCPPPDTPVKIWSGGGRRRVAVWRVLRRRRDFAVRHRDPGATEEIFGLVFEEIHLGGCSYVAAYPGHDLGCCGVAILPRFGVHSRASCRRSPRLRRRCAGTRPH